MKYLVIIAISLFFVTACQEEKVRTYTEKPVPQSPHAAMGKNPHAAMGKNPHGAMGAMGKAAPAAQAGERPTFSWKLPEGWKVEASGGMISATFLPIDAAEKFKATLIILNGEAGGVDGNLGRWLGQLGLAAAPVDIAKLKTAATPITSKKITGSLYDLTLTPTQENTFVVAILPVEGFSVFVKFQSDAATAKRNKQKFIDLLNSMEY